VPIPFSALGVVALLLLLFVAVRYEYVALTPAATAQSMMVAVSDAVLIAGPDTRIRDYNAAAVSLFGHEGEGLLGKSLSDRFTSENRAPVWSRESPQSFSEHRALSFEGEFITFTSRRIPVFVIDAPIMGDGAEVLGYLAVVRDIVEQKTTLIELAEKRGYLEHAVETRTKELNTANESLGRSRLILRNLSERLFEAKEKESARIARELHDELGQILTGLKIEVTLLRRKIQDPKHLVLVEGVIQTRWSNRVRLGGLDNDG
jgi:PAS domain S-box-containing protein